MSGSGTGSGTASGENDDQSDSLFYTSFADTGTTQGGFDDMRGATQSYDYTGGWAENYTNSGNNGTTSGVNHQDDIQVIGSGPNGVYDDEPTTIDTPGSGKDCHV